MTSAIDYSTFFRVYLGNEPKSPPLITSSDAAAWLLREQPMSINWAISKGGWSVETIRPKCAKCGFESNQRAVTMAMEEVLRHVGRHAHQLVWAVWSEVEECWKSGFNSPERVDR